MSRQLYDGLGNPLNIGDQVIYNGGNGLKRGILRKVAGVYHYIERLNVHPREHYSSDFAKVYDSRQIVVAKDAYSG